MKTRLFRGLAAALVLTLVSAGSVQAQIPLKPDPNKSLTVSAQRATGRTPLSVLANRSHPLRPSQSSLRAFKNGGKTPRVVKAPLKAAGEDLFTLHAFNFIPYDGAFMEKAAYMGTLPFDPAGPFVKPENTLPTYGVESAIRVGDYFYINYKYPAEVLGVENDVKVIDIYAVVYYNDEADYQMMSEVFDNADLGIEPDVAEKVSKAWGTSMTLDRTQNQIYVLAPGSGTTRLVKVNWSTEFVPEPTDVATLTGEWFSLSCDNSGQLYAMKVERTDGAVTATKLHKIDKATGKTTLVGDTGEKPWQDAGAAIDPNDNTLYWVVQDNRDSASRLVTVNLSTGAATTVYTYSYDTDEHPVGVFGYVAPNPNTPEEPTDLSPSFEGPSLTGTLTFKAPVNTISGEPGDPSKELTYTVGCDGSTDTGKCKYGEEVTAKITVSDNGYFTASVKVADGNLESKVATIEFYAGRAVPSSVQPKLEYDAENQMFNVTWDEPSTRYVKGYYNPDDITYTLTRYPDKVVVAEKIKERQFSESCEGFGDKQFAHYYYELLVYHADIPSNNGYGVASYAVPMGRIQPPYRDDLDKASRTLLGYTVIDGNGDNTKWSNGIGYISLMNPGNSSDTANDWLITPNMYLERGKTYYVDFSAYVNYYSPGSGKYEPLDIYIGREPTISSMLSGTKAGEFKVTGTLFEPDKLRVSCTPDETGIYYLGFCSRSTRPTGCGAIYLLPWEFSSGVAQSAPDVPVFKSVERQINGDLEATVTITAPSKSIDGSDLTSLSRIDVMRAGAVVKTFENPTPGADLAPFVDNVDKPGDHSWTAVAYNESGAGKISDIFTAFIGQDIAAAPENLKVTEPEWGKIHATWDQVTTDRNGNRIDPSRITYMVADYVKGSPIASDLKATEYEGSVLGRHDPQQWYQFLVYAFNESGNERERFAMTDPMVIGAPLEEYHEIWERGVSDFYPAYTLWVENEGSASVNSTGITFPGMVPHTGYGMLEIEGMYENDASSVITPRVDLSKQEYPAFSLSTYGVYFDETESINEIEVYVRVQTERGVYTDWQLASRKTVSEIALPNRWGRLVVNLDQYKDKVVQLKVLGRLKNFTNILFDDFAVASIPPVDLAVDRIEAPAAVKPGTKFNVSVLVGNYGASNIDKYSVELDVNGVKTTLDGAAAIATSEKDVVTFEVEMPGFDEPKALNITATAVVNDDAEAGNNAQSAIVDPELTRLPAPTDFKGSLNSAGVPELFWGVPTATFHPAVKETFSVGEIFKDTYNDWIFIDRDQKPVADLFFIFTIPNVTLEETKTSWMVWNADGTQGVYGDYLLGSDDVYSLMAYPSLDNEETDDWAISPELDGSAQTISFNARGLLVMPPPVFDVYYSMGSTDPKDFIAVPGMIGIKPLPAFWTTYYARVPEGARRVAFRSRIKDYDTMLQIDEVNYISANAAEVTPAGYRLYRDDVEAFNTEALTWTDIDAEVGSHAYRVSATYAGYGESAPTKAIMLTTEAGLLSVAGSDIAVSVDGRQIVVSGAEGKLLNICDTLGRNFFCGFASANTRVSVAPGVYLVVVDGRTAKVIVL